MKKFFTLVVLALLAVGCAKEYDDSGLRELIAGLDLRVSELEANVSALQSALGDGKFVRKVEEYKDPETGRTTGVTVTYTDGNIVHFNIVPADPTQGPVFSVIRNGAGELVWAVDGKAVKMDDEEIPVYQTPVFSIDEEGNLWVEVDGKKTNLGPVKSEGATLQDGIFTNLAVTDSAVVLTLSDNSVVNIPFAEAFQLLVEKEEYVFTAANPVVEIPYTVTAKTENTVVGAYYDIEKFGVKVEPEKLTVTAFSEKASGMIMLYADSKVGLTSIVSVIVTPEGVRILDEPYSATVNYLAEGEDATVVSNVVSNIAFDVVPVDEWIHVASVRSQAYTITLKLDDNLTGELREGTVNIVRAGTEEVVQTIKIAQLAAVIETGTKNLSRKGAANSYIVTEAGDYKFWAVKGNSGQEVNPATVEVLWETWNNAEEVTANSVVASVELVGSYVKFSTPETLKPGNAVIAAKDVTGTILWSWHIWVPATEVGTVDNAIFSSPAMDRNLGALVAATTGAEAPVESFGLTYQWGRKDPFPGPKAANSSSNATVAGVALSMTDGAGEADESKISLLQSIENPTLLGHAKNSGWALPAENTLWQDDVKTMYDPCPPGYRVPALGGNSTFFNEDVSALVGWEENKAQYYFALGNPALVFPFAGYRDDYGPDSMTHAYDRAAYWSSSSSSDEKAAYLNVRAGSAHAKADAGKSRAGSVRCVVAEENPILPPDEPDQPTGSATDLSETASANSYLVEKAGDYKFKAVKGNSEEAVAPASVEVLWETVNTTTAPEAGAVIAHVAFADGYVTFSTPATLVPGNALIAAKDAAGVILWSWHIWIPATPVVASTFGGVVGVPMMDRNLGALVAAAPNAKPDGTAIGMLYQWGRKDPFPGVASVDASDPVATTGNIVLNSEKQNFSVEESIQNPTVYVKTGSDSNKTWVDVPSTELWGKTKTVYDPCPPGYIVSTRDKSWAFWGGMASATGFKADTENKIIVLGVEPDPASPETTGYIVLPIGGYLDQGEYAKVGARAYIWSSYSSSSEANIAYQIYINGESVSTTEQRMSRGGNVRCVVEQ